MVRLTRWSCWAAGEPFYTAQEEVRRTRWNGSLIRLCSSESRGERGECRRRRCCRSGSGGVEPEARMALSDVYCHAHGPSSESLPSWLLSIISLSRRPCKFLQISARHSLRIRIPRRGCPRQNRPVIHQDARQRKRSSPLHRSSRPTFVPPYSLLLQDCLIAVFNGDRS